MLTTHLDYLLNATAPESFRAAAALSEANGERAEAMAERAFREVAGIVFGRLADAPDLADVAVTVAAMRALHHSAVGRAPMAERDAWKLAGTEAVREARMDLRAARARELLSGDDAEILGESDGALGRLSRGQAEARRMAPVAAPELISEAVATMPTARARAIVGAVRTLWNGREWTGGEGTRRRASLGPVAVAAPGNSATLRALGESVTGAARERVATEIAHATAELADAVRAILTRHAAESGHAGRVAASDAVAALDIRAKRSNGAQIGPAWHAGEIVREKAQRVASGNTHAERKATAPEMRMGAAREAKLARVARGAIGDFSGFPQYSAAKVQGATPGAPVGNGMAGQGAPVATSARAEMSEARKAEAARAADISRADGAATEAAAAMRDARHAEAAEAHSARLFGRTPRPEIAEAARRAEAKHAEAREAARIVREAPEA